MRCAVCDVDLVANTPCPNYWCGRDDRAFDAVWAVGRHEGRLRRAIAALKYRSELRWAEPLGRLLVAFLLDRAPEFDDVDLIAGVPGSVGRPDHVKMVLDAAAPLVGDLWDVQPHLIVKDEATRRLMETRSADARRLWAAGELHAVVHTTRPVTGNVLVVDDVFTDGSTLREVAAALHRAGAARVSGLVLARQPLRFRGRAPATGTI